MMTIFRIFLKNAVRDVYLLFWSILLPLGMLIGLGLYFNTPEYHVRLLAGVIGTSALFWALETTVFYILKQRNRGVYKLLRVTPMKIFSFIIALTLAWTVVSLAVATILLIGGLVLFGIRMQFGNLLIFYVTLVTATICFTLISFVVANISKNEGQASIYSNIFAMPMLFLSSAFYSLDTAPTWIKTLSRLNPFSHFVSGLHSTIVFDLRGAAANLFILLAFGVLALIAAILTFRWDSD